MELSLSESVEESATQAAVRIAALLREAIDQRGRASIALSGGSSPLPLYTALAAQPLDWSVVEVYGVDERVVPSSDAHSNAAAIRTNFIAPTGAIDRLFTFGDEPTGNEAAAEAHRVANELVAAYGSPPILDVVHLGLGSDGHTASWPSGHAVLDELHSWVSVIDEFNGYDRVTITPPVVNAARHVVWFILGDNKRSMLVRLMQQDDSIAASRVTTRHQMIFSTVDRRAEAR